MPAQDFDKPETSPSASGQPPPQPERVAFMPDEVCIVVERKQTLTPDDAVNLYEIVGGALNRLEGPVLLTPLESQHGPIVSFLTKADSTAAHLYYRRTPAPNETDAQRNQALRDLILRLNYQLGLHNVPHGIANELEITAVTPHWVGGACPGGGDDDGPAAPPEPVARAPGRPENWRFRFYDGRYGDRDLDGIIQADREAATGNGAEVVVAILDTSPDPHVVQAAVAKYGNRNTLLCQVDGRTKPNREVVAGGGFNPVSLDGPITPAASNLALLGEVVPNWSGRLAQWRSHHPDHATRSRYREIAFDMPDHGLFAAGIIKDIAPTAEIHLVRMVNDWGMTNANALADTATALLNQAWVRGKKLVVNLSVTFPVPTYEQFKVVWKSAFLDGLSDDNKRALHKLLSRNLRDVMDALVTAGALVVSAVGNYDDPGVQIREEPRYPAFFPNVLSVAALSRERVAAKYSNCGDDAANLAAGTPHGIATLGGDVDWGRDGVPLIEGRHTDDVDAIRGIFSTPTLPHRNGKNQTGWVYWVGTSFATPIIAGVAAALWRVNLGNDPAEMIRLVRTYRDAGISRDSQRDLKCPAIFAVQELV